MISSLGDDLLVEILIRLPNPRFASRCKPVSKRWCSVISDPCFNRRYVSHHQRPPLLLPSDDPQSILPDILPMPCGVDRLRFTVLDSFKDLLLCGFALRQALDAEFRRSYFICNLFTKQWIALPLSSERPSGAIARLVCEPIVTNELDLGDGQTSVYSECRFRVVLIYKYKSSVKLDLFCSETGEWTKEALVLDNHCRLDRKNVVSCNGELFWAYLHRGVDGVYRRLIAAFNPFRPDIPPACIRVPANLVESRWDFSISQGFLYVIVYEKKPPALGCSAIRSSVWRLQKRRISWRKICAGLLKTTPRSLHREKADIEWEAIMLKHFPEEKTSRSNYDVEGLSFPFLHPENPEIIFFHYFARHLDTSILSCNLRSGELEFFSKLRIIYAPRWAAFLVQISCCPTPIPGYDKLKVLYNGSYGCWVQSDEPTTSPITGPTTPPITEKRQPVGGVEHSGHWRKNNSSASTPRRLCYDAEIDKRLKSSISAFWEVLRLDPF